MIEKLEIVGNEVKSFTKEEFRTFMSERIDKFMDEGAEEISAQAKLIILLTLTSFAADVTCNLFGKEE